MTESEAITPDERRRRLACPHCAGSGVSRNSRQFFYGISLIASGILVFYEWPPIPSLIAMIEALARTCGLPGLAGTVAIWVLAAVPATFGMAFIYLWLAQDTCPACNGSRKSPVVL